MRDHRGLVLAHGGAEADPRAADGPQRAAAAGARAMERGASAMDAVVAAIEVLESDERFNAGLGSSIRLDGHSVHMDAALTDSRRRFGAVIGLDDVEHPVAVAREMVGTPHVMLMGEGARRFARARGHAPFDPRTPRALQKTQHLLARIRSGEHKKTELAWSREELRAAWNYEDDLDALLADAAPRAPQQVTSSDTVGAVAFDGVDLAAGASTGGLVGVLAGRVSDSWLPGCGLEADEHGAVTVSGAGEHIVRARVASRVLALVREGATPEEAAARAMAWLPEECALAVLVVDREGRSSARGRQPFPWASAEAAARPPDDVLRS